MLKQTGFWQLLAQTLIWTVVCIFFHVTLGIGLALMLNRKLRGRTIYRALLILPWAIPVFISLQIWRTEFNYQFGAVNQVLGLFGMPPQQWLSDPIMNFVAMIITNVWLGVPFMMVITLGGLQSISQDYYEASEIDGANGRQQFFGITLPLLRPVLLPAVLLGVFLTFNNIMSRSSSTRTSWRPATSSSRRSIAPPSSSAVTVSGRPSPSWSLASCWRSPSGTSGKRRS